MRVIHLTTLDRFGYQKPVHRRAASTHAQDDAKMSKKHSKAHASSGKAGAAGFGSGFGFGSGLNSTSTLSYAAEPPDLTLISDANIVVIFKNLAKKDGTTKTKALEELQIHIQSLKSHQQEVEDPIIHAWTKCYPRLSIDSDRRVRQLSHTLQGRLSLACGKSIALYLSKIVGSWLAGLYDNDRATARAAQESLKLVFPTSEKLYNLRKIYHASILQYCQDAIFNETAQTLSDERSVSHDDAEAKYARVISSSLMLVSSLMSDLDMQEISKHEDAYDELLGGKNLWKFSHFEDSSVRRAVYRLMRVSLDKKPDVFSQDLGATSNLFLYKGLGIRQLGSSADFVECLVSLTINYPTVWTDHYMSKKPVLDRLTHFLSRGSQMGTAHFWSLISQLLQEIPIVSDDLDDNRSILHAMHNGVTCKDEPRPNLEAAWMAYLTAAEYLARKLSTNDKSKLLTDLVLPIVTLHIRPDPSRAQWYLPVASWSIALLTKAVQLLGEVLADAWLDISSLLVADMKISSPEQAKGFEPSQDALALQGERWASILAIAVEQSSLATPLFESAAQVIDEAISLLKVRNGKPYGAASVIESALRKNSRLLEHDSPIFDRLSSFISHDAAGLILTISSSSVKLVQMLLTCSHIKDFQGTWREILRGLLLQSPAQDGPDSRRLNEALKILISSPQVRQCNITHDTELQGLLTRKLMAQLDTDSSPIDDPLIPQILSPDNAVISSDSVQHVLSNLTESLSVSEQPLGVLTSLEIIQRFNVEVLGKFISTTLGSNLVSELLSLSESADEDIATKASNLSASLMTGHRSSSKDLVINIISRGLSEASPSSVSVTNLVNLAQNLWAEAGEEQSQIAERIFPDPPFLHEALSSLFQTGPPSDLAITNSLGGAVYLISKTEPTEGLYDWDISGFSRFLRIIFYVTQLVSHTNAFDFVEQEHQRSILEFLELGVQLLNEDISLGGERGLFAPNVENEAPDVLSDAQLVINKRLQRSKGWSHSAPDQSESRLVSKIVESLYDSSKGSSPSSYYYSLAWSAVVRELVELHGCPVTLNQQPLEVMLETIRKSEGE